MDGSCEDTLEITGKPSTGGKRQECNTLELQNFGMQSIRYSVSLRATAAITTSAFMDAGLITEEDKRLVVYHNKVKKPKKRYKFSK